MNVSLLGVGLSSAQTDDGTFDLMRKIVTGTSASGTCGAIQSPVPGDFTLVSDLDDLLFAFNKLRSLGRPSRDQELRVCVDAPCPEGTHAIVLDPSIGAIDVLAGVTAGKARLVVIAPDGRQIDTVGNDYGVTNPLGIPGVNATITWRTEKTASIRLQRDGTEGWAGPWRFVFLDDPTDPAEKFSRTSIQVTGDLKPVWPQAVAQARQDEELAVSVAVADANGTVVDAGALLGEVAVRAQLIGPDGTVSDLITGGKESLGVPVPISLAAVPMGAATIRISTAVTTAAWTSPEGEVVPGTALAAETVDLPLQILAPLGYPALPSHVNFGSAVGQPALDAELPITGPGCVWLEPGSATVRETVANSVWVMVGPDGRVELSNTSSGTAQLVADVGGYYIGGSALEPGSYQPVSPARVLDTRTGVGGRGPVQAGGSVALQIAGRGGVPATGVAAVVLNITVTEARSFGYVTAYPSGQPRPNASNLNYVAGQTVPNLAVVKVGADGKVMLSNSGSGSAQLIADVAGYFVKGAPLEAGTFNALSPHRIMDTRLWPVGVHPSLPAIPVGPGRSVTLGVLGSGGVPAYRVSAVVLNLTATEAQSFGFVTVHPNGQARPNASNLNYRAGQTVPNLVVVKVGDGGSIVFTNTSSGSVQLIADVAGYYGSEKRSLSTKGYEDIRIGMTMEEVSNLGYRHLNSIAWNSCTFTEVEVWTPTGFARLNTTFHRNRLITLAARGPSGKGVVDQFGYSVGDHLQSASLGNPEMQVIQGGQGQRPRVFVDPENPELILTYYGSGWAIEWITVGSRYGDAVSYEVCVGR